MSRLKELNPKQGDVLNIKFKSVNSLISENVSDDTPYHMIVDYYGLEYNIRAYVANGHFIVTEDFNPKLLRHMNNDNDGENCIVVKNHHDCNDEFYISESAIESIAPVDASEVFVSGTHGISVVRIDHEMFINGEPLIWNEKQMKEYNDGDWENPNRRLISMFEAFIGDLAVRDTFQDEGED